MELALKAALTASLIAALVLAATWLGTYAAGLVSGLPLTSLPTLLWIGIDRGTAAATDAAAGGITGCALASVFALAYHVAARRGSPASALAFSVACLAAGVALASRVPLELPVALALACIGAAGSLATIGLAGQATAAPTVTPGATATRPVPLRQKRSRAVLSALAVGASGAAVTFLVIAWRPSLAGIVAAMPIVGVVMAVTTHATRGSDAVPGFLFGYVISSLGKTAFCTVFALCAPSGGLALALVAACAACGCVCLPVTGLATTGPSATRAATRAGRAGRVPAWAHLDSDA